jgi:hypothetical protein
MESLFLIKKFLYHFREKSKKGLRRGVPTGLDEQLLRELCLQHRGQGPNSIYYEHLSGWKKSGAYRLIIKFRDKNPWKLIFKNCVYDSKEIPGLKDLAVRPGSPEYLVYNSTEAALSDYLPVAYLCEEVSPARHYRYILEDLGDHYRKPSSREDLGNIVTNLRGFHKSFLCGDSSLRSNGWITYDSLFWENLIAYVESKLEKFSQIDNSDMISEFAGTWDKITGLTFPHDYYPDQLIWRVHGDLNSSNTLVHNAKSNLMKMLDWEWAGWGLPHWDLATLLKGKFDDIIQDNLIRYAELNPELSYAEHRHLFFWCLLQRGLLDAAFMVEQLMETTFSTSLDKLQFIEKSIAEVIRAYKNTDR